VNTWSIQLKARLELVVKRMRGATEMRIAFSSQSPRAVRDVLHVHCERDIGVRADPDFLPGRAGGRLFFADFADVILIAFRSPRHRA
jgi:hypothetical protein